MSNRKTELLLEDILESANKIFLYTKEMSFEQFVSDGKTIDAVIRNFEVIGEAANRLPDSFTNQHAEIDWKRIKGFRNRIVHEYFGIDYSIVWLIKDTYLPELISKISNLM